MATPTTIYANWTQVQFTPSGGSPIVFSRVSGVDFDPGGTLLPYSGDANRYPVALINMMNHPRATVQCENLAIVNAVAPGSKGTFQAVLNDAINGDGVGSGAIRFALSNAVVQNSPVGGRHQHYAHGTVTLHGYSSDGTTNPLSATVL
jgi:hypothetical protein